MQRPPIRRHKGLQTLSREHHFALLYGKRLQNYRDAEQPWLERGWAELRQRLRDFWENALAVHFAAEEQHLPWDRIAPRWRERLLQEHSQIERLWQEVSAAAAPPRAALAQLGEALCDHARWEDRELFPVIEANVPESELEAVAVRIGEMPAADPAWLPPRPTS